MTPDLRLYALVDPAVAGGRSLPELAKLLVGTATLVQLRDKHGTTRAMIDVLMGVTVSAMASKTLPRPATDGTQIAKDSQNTI